MYLLELPHKETNMRKLFSKRNPTPNEVPDSRGETGCASVNSSHSSHSSHSIPRSLSRQQEFPLDLNIDSNTVSPSFQYSYNSNTTSLFSSKRTVSTGLSSNAGSNTSYNQKGNEQSKIVSRGRPLRVLLEEDQEENYELQNLASPAMMGIATNSEASMQPYNQNSSLSTSAGLRAKARKKSSNADDASILTETSSSSATTSNFEGVLSDNEIVTQLNEYIKAQLKILASSIDNVIIQIYQSVLNLTKATVMISESMEMIILKISNAKNIGMLPRKQFDTINTIGLRKLIKNILLLVDSLLTGNVYNKSKSLILKNLHDLFVLIRVLPKGTPDLSNFVTKMSPKNFAIGATAKDPPNISKVGFIMDRILSRDTRQFFSDQNGSFIAPVLRGFILPELSIITFIFGFPMISKEHQDVIKYFSTISADIHFLLQKNKIIHASGMRLKSPFRQLDEENDYVPISMSISTDISTTTSGTLGGYIYPKVDDDVLNPRLLKYKGQVFGLTCAHVVLNQESISGGAEKLHPRVFTPSPVLINLYRRALVSEMMNHSNTTPEYKVYYDAVQKIDEKYPIETIVVNSRSKKRNLPPSSLGNVVWGERLIDDNKLSDIAIIKINDGSKKKFVNYLGEDIQLSQYDPSLILSNLNVKRTVSLQPRKHGILNTANLNVFKIGSTTNYTRGTLNGMKLIYWSNGSLRSSEFIISNEDNKEGFANGGDSGAWILSKLVDVNDTINSFDDEPQESGTESERQDDYKNSLAAFIESFIPKVSNKTEQINNNAKKNKQENRQTETGLGVLGMLHSYDGEYKQFGLFSPIDDILDRLYTITGVKWGIVGCFDDDNTELFSSKSIVSGEMSLVSTSDENDVID